MSGPVLATKKGTKKYLARWKGKTISKCSNTRIWRSRKPSWWL